MLKFEVQVALEKVREARAEWAAGSREFRDGVDKVMSVLLHEAARNRMSVHDVAHSSGLTNSQVRDKMRAIGLNPRDGKTLLADHAAKALAENAELLGVNVDAMDLLSPLAYMPMGNQLRNELQSAAVRGVVELELDEFLETKPEPLPPVYKEDSDEFNPAWLEYLGSLDTEVGKGVWRISAKDGKVVRVELWSEADRAYTNIHLGSTQ